MSLLLVVCLVLFLCDLFCFLFSFSEQHRNKFGICLAHNRNAKKMCFLCGCVCGCFFLLCLHDFTLRVMFVVGFVCFSSVYDLFGVLVLLLL